MRPLSTLVGEADGHASRGGVVPAEPLVPAEGVGVMRALRQGRDPRMTPGQEQGGGQPSPHLLRTHDLLIWKGGGWRGGHT